MVARQRLPEAQTGAARRPRPRRLACLPPALAALLCACSESRQPFYQGYIEGEFLYLSAPQAGYLRSLDALRGSRVAPGQAAFALAGDPDAESLDEAQARVAAARERLANLAAPRRQPEIAALEANLRAAQASLSLAQSRLGRQQSLAERHFVSPASLDEARSQRDQMQGQVDAAQQQLATYRAALGRGAEVRAAEADLLAAQAQAAQMRWRLESKTVRAPAAGEISETYYRAGEWVAAGAPVASLLPDQRRRLRFYVPETALARLRPGLTVEAGCDGCTQPIRGTIDFIAPQAEYTPPVIYSRGSREKLVFRVEAVPLPEQAARLRPGLPIDVRILER
ncbi:HlyD family secretion protein [Noviherbaspirillum soli]|uniref:HlyD family secretion protein n=1 Tax=Noviherbaspirillum soli TaxID=1064518 RepID=UPI00188AC7F7|nr:HlyD family efflux transporter periplasmic adaptor subunit [Noviherbaspirillum soli]